MLPEVEQYVLMIEDLYDQVIGLIAGLSVDAMNWRPIEGEESHETNTLAVLSAHIAGMTREWGNQVAGKSVDRDRPGEFNTQGAKSEDLVNLLQEVKAEIRELFTPLTDEDLSRQIQVRDYKINTRWAILHIIDHTALHLGHMQITYQLGNNGHAGASPRWFERV